MGDFEMAQVCLNGHVVNDACASSPKHCSDYCSQCGAEAITTCPKCSSKIRGYFNPGTVALGRKKMEVPPAFCHNCGNPYPWTQSAIDSAALLIREDQDFPLDLADNLIEVLPDLIVETPRTNLAVSRAKKALVVCGKYTADGIRQFIIDFGCALALKHLGS